MRPPFEIVTLQRGVVGGSTQVFVAARSAHPSRKQDLTSRRFFQAVGNTSTKSSTNFI
jgi:hypothetical protein